jgi:prolyl oligopeptidase
MLSKLAVRTDAARLLHAATDYPRIGFGRRTPQHVIWKEAAPGDQRGKFFFQRLREKNAKELFSLTTYGSDEVVAVTACPTGERVAITRSLGGTDTLAIDLWELAEPPRKLDSFGPIRGGNVAWDRGCDVVFYSHAPANSPNNGAGQLVWSRRRVGGGSRDDVVTAASGDPSEYPFLSLEHGSRRAALVRMRGATSTTVELCNDIDSPRWELLPTPPSTKVFPYLYRGRTFALVVGSGKPDEIVEYERGVFAKPLVRGLQGRQIKDFTIVKERLVYIDYRAPESKLVSCKLEGAACKVLPTPSGASFELPASVENEAELLLESQSVLEAPSLSLIELSGQHASSFRLGESFRSRFRASTENIVSRDGTASMLVLVEKASDATARSSEAPKPVLLTGYGGFGLSMLGEYNPALVAWADLGGVGAIAVARGGGEFGEEWHRAGQRIHKQRTFDDFVAGAEWLVRSGRTRPGRIAAFGASNGGLLVTAAITQRPELFGAGIALTPLTDMLRYDKVGAGPQWMDEYGNPDDPSERAALAAYSPLHRISAGLSYPPTMLVVGAADDRVHPMHARKFVAAMHANVPPSVSYLDVMPDSGHGGPSTLEGWLRVHADALAFAWEHTAREPTEKRPERRASRK